MRNGFAFLKPIFGSAALAIVAATLFSSCQKTSTTNGPDIGDWAKKTEYAGIPRTQAVSFTINGNVYIGGGYNGNTATRLNDFYEFVDGLTPSWIPVDNFPGDPRNGAAGFSINNKGYMIGGYDGTSYLNDIWQFDPSQSPGNQWTPIQPNNPASTFTPRVNAVGFALNNVGYVGTGLDSAGSWHEDFWKFDGTNLTQVSSIGEKRTGASAFVYNNIAYVVGGTNNGTYLPDLWSYDGSADLWTRKRNIINDGDSSYEASYGNNITRSLGEIFLINDTAYYNTGNYNGVIGTTWAYDIGQDLWFQKTSFEGAVREGAVGFSVNNHGYVTTGDNGSNFYDDTWEFFPDAAQTNTDNY
jgi:N-acetylneuraminic acid mutarotase